MLLEEQIEHPQREHQEAAQQAARPRRVQLALGSFNSLAILITRWGSDERTDIRDSFSIFTTGSSVKVLVRVHAAPHVATSSKFSEINCCPYTAGHNAARIKHTEKTSRWKYPCT